MQHIYGREIIVLSNFMSLLKAPNTHFHNMFLLLNTGVLHDCLRPEEVKRSFVIFHERFLFMRFCFGLLTGFKCKGMMASSRHMFVFSSTIDKKTLYLWVRVFFLFVLFWSSQRLCTGYKIEIWSWVRCWFLFRPLVEKDHVSSRVSVTVKQYPQNTVWVCSCETVKGIIQQFILCLF